MKLMKSLLLGTAAGFAAVAGAQAADLPTRKAAPVEYVRICSLGGGKFVGYVVPGSDVCLRVGGFVRWQYTSSTPYNTNFFVPVAGGLDRVNNGPGYPNRFSGQTATASLQLDARTQTEWGLLRAFADMRIDQGYQQTGAYIDKAFINFGGFTFGKYQSYFDFYADAFNNIGALGSDHSAIGAAYSAQFGNFFATLSLEDATTTWGSPNYYGLGGTLYPSALNNVVQGGYRIPDVVAQLLYQDAWGAVQLSGALHQVRGQVTGFDSTTVGDNTLYVANGTTNTDTKYGWAVQGGVKFNVPSFGPGDALYLQAAYEQGASLYVQGINGYGKVSQSIAVSDAIATGTGSLKLVDGWNALAAFQHTFTPTVSAALWGSYTAFNYPSDGYAGVNTVGGAALTGRDFHYWQAGAQVNWTPVSKLTVSGTVNYINTTASRLAYDSAVLPSGTYIKKSSDGVAFALRVQRDF
jgi:hypothetical protein